MFLGDRNLFETWHTLSTVKTGKNMEKKSIFQKTSAMESAISTFYHILTS